MDTMALAVCWATLWAGLLFYRGDMDQGWSIFVSGCILLVNTGFALWGAVRLVRELAVENDIVGKMESVGKRLFAQREPQDHTEEPLVQEKLAGEGRRRVQAGGTRGHEGPPEEEGKRCDQPRHRGNGEAGKGHVRQGDHGDDSGGSEAAVHASRAGGEPRSVVASIFRGF